MSECPILSTTFERHPDGNTVMVCTAYYADSALQIIEDELLVE